MALTAAPWVRALRPPLRRGRDDRGGGAGFHRALGLGRHAAVDDAVVRVDLVERGIEDRGVEVPLLLQHADQRTADEGELAELTLEVFDAVALLPTPVPVGACRADA